MKELNGEFADEAAEHVYFFNGRFQEYMSRSDRRMTKEMANTRAANQSKLLFKMGSVRQPRARCTQRRLYP